MKLLVIKRVTELPHGRGLEGIVMFDGDDESGEMWTLDGRRVLEANSLSDYKIAPLSVDHLDKLFELKLIDIYALRRLVCIVVR